MPASWLEDLSVRVQTAGVELPKRRSINFTTAQVTDDPVNNRTNVAEAPTEEDIFDTFVTVSPLKAVYLSAANTVDLADADDVSKRPIVGIVASKPTSTTAIVRTSGSLPGFSSLVPGATYFLAKTPGEITNVAPSAVGDVVQRVGYAKNTTTLMVMVDRDFIVL